MKFTLTTLALVVATAGAFAQVKTFKVVGEKLAYRNLGTVESVTEFETFTGKTNAVSGSLIFNPKAHTGSGIIILDPSTIDTAIPARNEHMKSEGWLDTAKYPTIKFETTKVSYAGGDNYKVIGKFTLHGVTKTVSSVVRLRYRAEGADTKKAGFDGDVAQIYTKFQIKLKDYGIKIPAMAAGKVSEEVTVAISAYATTK